MLVSIWLFGGNDASDALLLKYIQYKLNKCIIVKNYELVRFTDNDFELDVRADVTNETVWLTQEEMALLFNSNRTKITRHISNIIKDGELEEKSNVRKTHFPHSDRPVKMFDLDMIISVGYRVKSKRGILFSQIYRKRF